ncbi:MAG: hypothetical protein ACRD9W_00270, partial [Terriglobia bacterium]
MRFHLDCAVPPPEPFGTLPLIWHTKGVFPAAILIIVWLIAAVGIALKLCWPERFDGLSIALYLMLGWSGILAFGP